MIEDGDRPAASREPGDPLPRPRGAARWIARASLGVAIITLAWSAWAALDAAGHQAWLARRLDALLRDVGLRPNPRGLGPMGAERSRAEAAESGLIGRIEIERVGLRSMIVEGTGGRQLRRAVGHIAGSPYPGEAGNAVLTGHRDTFFRALEKVRERDRIRVTTPDGVFEYAVVSMQVVGPERMDVAASGSAPELTLITCYPFRFVGPAPERYVVTGRLDSSATVAVSAAREGRSARAGRGARP